MRKTVAEKKVLRMGHPILQKTAQNVEEFGTAALSQLLTDLEDTMKVEGGVGIAAPQIGVSLRVVVFGFKTNARYPDAPPVPSTVLINPKIEFIGDEMEDGWEGCLSVPGMRGLVSRHRRLKYSGYSEKGLFFEKYAEDFHARVVQHECDHLDGILYPMRIKNLRSFGYTEELDAQS